MRCKFCAYNYGSHCSTGVYDSNNEYFKKWNDTLGCSGGKVDSKFKDVVRNFYYESIYSAQRQFTTN